MNENKPVVTIRDAITPSVSCAIWEREGEHGRWYTVGAPQISKNVGRKNGGADEWKHFSSFSVTEIPAAIRVMNQAIERVGELLSKDRELKRENSNSISAGNGYANNQGNYDDEDFEEVI